MKNSAEVNAIAEEKDSDAADRKELITQRARELYQLRGCEEGHALEDWLRAEAEIMGKLRAQDKPSDEVSAAEPARRDPATPSRRGFFNVRVGKIVYTAQYDPGLCDSYKPGMLRKGQPVELRFEDDRIFMKLPNSKEIEAKVVKKRQV